MTVTEVAQSLGWQRMSNHHGRIIVWTTDQSKAKKLEDAGATVTKVTDWGQLGWDCSWPKEEVESADFQPVA